MQTAFRAILASILTSLSAVSAMAEVSVYFHTGSWDAFTGSATNGKLVCGAGSTNPSDNRSISMRFEIGGTWCNSRRRSRPGTFRQHADRCRPADRLGISLEHAGRGQRSDG